MTTFQAFKQYLEDLEVGLAKRFDDLDIRLDTIATLLDERLRIDSRLVAERLELTPAQSRVAVGLAEGKTVDDIAREIGCAKSTVRWHLKEINLRLGISTQAQLVRLILLPQGTVTKHKPNA